MGRFSSYPSSWGLCFSFFLGRRNPFLLWRPLKTASPVEVRSFLPEYLCVFLCRRTTFQSVDDSSVPFSSPFGNLEPPFQEHIHQFFRVPVWSVFPFPGESNFLFGLQLDFFFPVIFPVLLQRNLQEVLVRWHLFLENIYSHRGNFSPS